MSRFTRWIKRALLVGIGMLMWRYHVSRFERIDVQLHELDLGIGGLTREVVANGKNIARIGDHPEDPDPSTGHPPDFRRPLPNDS